MCNAEALAFRNARVPQPPPMAGLPPVEKLRNKRRELPAKAESRVIANLSGMQNASQCRQTLPQNCEGRAAEATPSMAKDVGL